MYNRFGIKVKIITITKKNMEQPWNMVIHGSIVKRFTINSAIYSSFLESYYNVYIFKGDKS